MTSRTAIVRSLAFAATLAGLLLVGLATSKEARAGWWGCGGNGFACTSIEESCIDRTAANFPGETFLYYTMSSSNRAACHTTPRLGGYTTFDTTSYCPGQLSNTGRADGCQDWEEPDDFGPCPTCGAGTPTGTGPGSPSGPVGGGGGSPGGNPITLSNGNKFQAVTDYRSSGTDVLEFTRYYNSLSWAKPNMGWGWRHNFSAGLHLESATATWVHRPEGGIERFTSADGNNPWVAQKGGIVGRFAKTSTGWTYTRPDDTVEVFNASGGLLSIVRKNGYTQTIDKAYNGVSGIWAITDSHGRALKLYHTYYGAAVGWRLKRVVDPDGRVYIYEYQGLSSYNSEPWILDRVAYPDDDDLPLDIADTPLGVNDVLYTHLDGPDGATYATDESASAHPLTFAGTAQIDTAQSYLGGASALFDGTATSYISAPDGADWEFGAGQFTVEGWVRFASTAAYSTVIKHWDGASNQRSWLIDWTTANQIRFLYSTDGVTYVNTIAASWTPTVGAWHHIAVDRDSGNRLRLYVDGNVLIDTVLTATIFSPATDFQIGKLFNGWIDEVRVTKGEARYGEAWNSRANNPAITYQYEDPRFHYALTGITDETGQRTATWSYNVEGRGLSSEHAGGTDSVSLTYNTDGTKTVSNSLGKAFKYSFATIGLLPRITQIDRLASADSPAAAMSFAYDATGLVNQVTDYNGNITKYVHDARGLQTSRTEAFGTPDERTTTTIWDPAFRVPTQIAAPERTTTMTYYPGGLLHTRTVTDTTTHTVPYSTNGQARTTTYTYNAQGLVETVDGPLAGAGDTTAYAYDPVTGNLTSTTNALGHATQIVAHDASGRPLTTEDANGVETTLAYDARGRLETRTVDSGAGGTPALTTFVYDDAGQMASTTLPDGSVMTYEYDAADRLFAIENGVGERIEYGYDPMGNRTAQTVKDASLTIVRQASSTFDDLGRMLKSLGAYVGEETDFAYDANGNAVSVTDPLSNVTGSAFDALNRLVTVTDALLNDATYTYDAAGNRETATDQRGLVTSYVHNGFGQAIQQSSPDTGVTVFEYDTAGRRTRRTDARGVVTDWTYDDLGRTLTMSFPASPAENVTYAYDDATVGWYGIGRMASVTDDSGSTSYRYDARGNILRDERVIGAQTYITEYAWDLADRMIQIVYPSGRIVDYARDSIGRVTDVTTKASAGATSRRVVGNATWQPFGPLAGYDGKGITGNPYRRSYDLDGRLAAMSLSSASTGLTYQDLAYTYDLAGNIKTITDAVAAGRSETYDYDELHRLTGATGAYGTEGWDYDAVGNRTARTAGAVSETYAYDAFSNRLLNVAASGGTRTLTYGDSGNTASDDDGAGAVLDFSYDSTDRLVGVSQGAAVLGAYTHNALGQRVAKTAGGATTHFLHGLSGRLLAEHSGGGGVAREYFWLDGQLLGFIDGGGLSPSFVATDHIGRPTRVIGYVTGLVRWNAIYRPFGELDNNRGAGFNIRFPGQYADAETGLYYNYFRDYDASLGRYIQSDPIGLQGGWNTYGYVGGNPVMRLDPEGLAYGDPDANEGVCGALEWLVIAANGFGMKWDNVIGNDKYYHCLANCELAEMGPISEQCAFEFFTKRERDFVKSLNPNGKNYGLNLADSEADERANRFGRWQGRMNREKGCQAMPCTESCSQLYPGYMPG